MDIVRIKFFTESGHLAFNAIANFLSDSRIGNFKPMQIWTFIALGVVAMTMGAIL